MKVHNTSVIETTDIDDTVEIGPYCLISKDVKLCKNVKILSHVVICGNTTIDEGTIIHPFSCIGKEPQIMGKKCDSGILYIGKNCIIRENVSIHTGSEKGDMITHIDDDCYIMSHVHIGHDVKIGKNVCIVTQTGIAGHAIIGNNVIISGQVGVKQFVKIGDWAFIGGKSFVTKNILPYSMSYGNPCRTHGLNETGFSRNKFDRNVINSALMEFSKLNVVDDILDMKCDENNFILMSIIKFYNENKSITKICIKDSLPNSVSHHLTDSLNTSKL